MATKYNYQYNVSQVSDYDIQHNPWKVPFSPKITQANIGIYSLFDLFYYESEGSIYRRYAPTQGSAKGVSLEHDIICYTNSIYNGNTVDRDKATLSTWAVMGFDIGYVEFDSRAKYRTVTLKVAARDDIASGGAQNYSAGDTVTVRIYDKNAALIPQTVHELTAVSGPIFGRSDDSTLDNKEWQIMAYKPYTVGSNDDAETYSSDIILCSADTVFNNTLIGKDGYESYNKLCLNINNLSGLLTQLLKILTYLPTQKQTLLQMMIFLVYVTYNQVLQKRYLMKVAQQILQILLMYLNILMYGFVVDSLVIM